MNPVDPNLQHWIYSTTYVIYGIPITKFMMIKVYCTLLKNFNEYSLIYLG